MSTAKVQSKIAGPIQFCGPTDCDCIYGAGTTQAAKCKELLKANPGGPSIGVDTHPITDPVMAAVQAAFKPFFDALPGFGVKVALFMGAFMFVIIGLWALTRNPSTDTSSAVTTSLNNVATGAGKHVGRTVAKAKRTPKVRAVVKP